MDSRVSELLVVSWCRPPDPPTRPARPPGPAPPASTGSSRRTGLLVSKQFSTTKVGESSHSKSSEEIDGSGHEGVPWG